MKVMSLFRSVAMVLGLGLNSLPHAGGAEYDTNYRYEGQPPNRLRTPDASQSTQQSNHTARPWYELLPEWSPESTSQFGPQDIPLNFARQQSSPVIEQQLPIPPEQHSFDSLIQAPDSYATVKDNWDAKDPWSTSHTWRDRVRDRFGSGATTCGTLWLAAADIYYLKRTVTSPVTILVDDTTRSIEEFNAQSLDFGHNVGYGVRLSRGIGCGASLNLGYFGLYDQQAATERTGDLALVVPGFATGGNPASYNSNYESELHSVEVNMRQALGGRFGILAGIRYINLQDDLLISSQLGAVVTPQHYLIDVDNNLFGAELGTDFCLVRWRALQIDALVNCGFYLNNASQTTSSALVGTPVTASTDAFAVAGQAGIFATYCFNDRLSLRAGYQVLGLHGIALAPEQLQQSNLATGTAGINTTGDAFYSGASLGLQFAW